MTTDTTPSSRRSFLGVAALSGIGAASLTGCTMGGGSPGSPGKPKAASAGNSKLHEVLERKQVIVGTGTGNPPWHFADKGGKLIGMDVELAHLLAQGLFGKADAVKFVQQSPDSRVPSLVTNKVDVVFQFMTVTAERAQQVEFTIPYYTEGAGLLLSPKSKYPTYKALKSAGKDARVSVLANGAIADQIVHRALPQAKPVQVDTEANVIQSMLSRQVDAAAVDASTVQWLTRTQPGKYRDAGFYWLAQSYAAAVRPGDQIWLNYLNSVLHEAMEGFDFPTYKSAYKKYFGITLTEPKIGIPQEYTAPQQ